MTTDSTAHAGTARIATARAATPPTAAVAPAATAEPARRAPPPPVGPGLAAQKAPPFVLPGEHFAIAMTFLVLGALALVWIAPEVARGSYPSPRVIATTHLFTLGWITTSIMGALYQFLPVALGEPVRSIRLAHLTYALYVPGLVIFVVGVATYRTGPMLAGAATLGTGVLLFAGNLGATLRRAAKRDVTWWALAGAATYLVVTFVFGAALAGNLRWGYLGGQRFLALGVHLHIALAGWVLLVMVGVAHRLLPMFLVSHGAGNGFAKAAVALIAAGAGVLALLHHAPPLVSRWLPGALLAAGLLCFLAQARSFYRHRRRPSLDPGMRLAAAALTLLATALALAGPVVLGRAGPRLATAYVAVVLLGISLFVAAHYYKIVPFLVWYHRFGPRAGKRPLPRVAELYSGAAATAAGALLVSGAAGLALSIAGGWILVARAAAALFAAGVVTEAFQMLALSRKRP
ncbi:MAG TPA: hypothetical protein VFQ22_02465 [Longimicrobiales bacterium]|nr:hypothetical protein [Longimicrobiales bacterium]